MPRGAKASLQVVADRQEIQNVLGTYCRAIDRVDLPLLKTVYHPDGIDDHGIFRGNAHEFAEMIIGHLRDVVDYGFHTVSHSVIDVHGQFAISETYYSGYHRIGAGVEKVTKFFGPRYAQTQAKAGTIDQAHEYTCGGRYLDLFEKRGGTWRILYRRITNEWGRTAPTLIDWSEGELVHLNLPGTRDRTDPVYTLMDRLAEAKQSAGATRAKGRNRKRAATKPRAAAGTRTATKPRVSAKTRAAARGAGSHSKPRTKARK